MSSARVGPDSSVRLFLSDWLQAETMKRLAPRIEQAAQERDFFVSIASLDILLAVLLTIFTIRGVGLKARSKKKRLSGIGRFAILALFGLSGLAACQSPPDPVDELIHYSEQSETVDPAIIYAERVSPAGLDYKEGWFDDGDNRIHFVAAGQGPLIVLYHGFPSNWLSWRDQIEMLAKEYRVIAVDGLGAGLSSKPREAELYRLEALSSQLDRLIEAVSPGEKFVLIGHDWGSVLALGYAQSRPGRVRAVVGMSAPPLNLLLSHLAISPDQQAISDYMQQFKPITPDMIEARALHIQVAEQSYAKLDERGDLTPEEVSLFHQSVGQVEAVNGGMNWYRANIPAWDEIDDNSKWPGPDVTLEVPSLFIWGDADTLFVPELIDNLRAAEPELTIVRLAGIGHWTSMQNPELANAAITEFLSALEATP